MVTKPQSREPVTVEMRGKKGPAGGKRVEKEEAKNCAIDERVEEGRKS